MPDLQSSCVRKDGQTELIVAIAIESEVRNE
jgi:hypothetical protein